MTKKITHERRRHRREKMANLAGRVGVHIAARRFEVTPSTVHAACKEFGVEPKPVPRLTKTSPRVLAILATVQGGESQASTARIFGISRQAVADLVRRAKEAGLSVEPIA